MLIEPYPANGDFVMQGGWRANAAFMTKTSETLQ